MLGPRIPKDFKRSLFMYKDYKELVCFYRRRGKAAHTNRRSSATVAEDEEDAYVRSSILELIFLSASCIDC